MDFRYGWRPPAAGHGWSTRSPSRPFVDRALLWLLPGSGVSGDRACHRLRGSQRHSNSSAASGMITGERLGTDLARGCRILGAAVMPTPEALAGKGRAPLAIRAPHASFAAIPANGFSTRRRLTLHGQAFFGISSRINFTTPNLSLTRFGRASQRSHIKCKMAGAWSIMRDATLV